MNGPISADLTYQFSLHFDGPLRSDQLSPDNLVDLAGQLARTLPIAKKTGSYALLRRLHENASVLKAARDEAAAAAARGEALMPDAEWLLDNFFIIEEVLREVRIDLPRSYYDELPAISIGPWADRPRVYALAIALVAHSDSHLDDGMILRFVRSFQETTPLTTGEIWAVPTMLRLALIENLRRLAAQMLTNRSEREKAIAWVSGAVGTAAATPLPNEPSDAFLVGWHQAVRDLGDAPLVTPRESRVRRAGPAEPSDWLARHAAGDLTEVLRREHRQQAANQVSVGNCVTSLRLLGAIDWAEFFERASLVEEALRSEPTGIYRKQEFATRDRYRQVIEGLAKASRRDEIEVARLAMARSERGETAREHHVGYHLIGPGRKSFARELGCHFPLSVRWRSLITDNARLAYIGFLVLLTGALIASAIVLTSVAGAPPWLLILLGLVAVLPASDAAVAIVNYFVCRIVPPRVLPKLDFSSGIPAECRTIVVIPGMLTKLDSAAALCERLELHFLANPDPQFRFALLTDWADASTETTASDESLLKAATDGIRRLNERYAHGGPDLFFLFHRKRQFNSSEGVWMGWERKRGKLDEFNRLLGGESNTSYLIRTGDAAAIGAKYVLTLDADTVLPRDAARRLVATLAHPLNRPVLSTDGRRVVAGYGVLQPRVSFLYKTGLRSNFARIFAGSAGIDPYSSASSDVYQDLFGWGTFTGKGLYDLEAFHSTAGTAFPENAILSHDLIESNFARCGLVTDVEVFDDFPAKYHAYAKREHRWIRGDWQLLPWLGRTVPTGEGANRNVLTLLGRWKIFDNLRRSLVPASLVLLLTLGWTILPGSGWLWSIAAFALLALPLALLLLDNLLDLILSGTPRTVLRGARQNLPATFGQVVLGAVLLANQAILSVDAIGRTLYRLFVSRKRMLEWETAAATEIRLGSGLLQFARMMWQPVVLVLVLLVLVAFIKPFALPAALPWLLIWLLSPLVAWYVSRPLADPEPALTDTERTELRRTARKTWRFFETFVTAEDNWLPPDNYQEDPKGVVAHRTSPTNKGLLLLSTLSAHDLGYISLIEMEERIKRTLDTMDRMDRYHGHFFNWYETTTLRPLPPEYISTVDSGNLLGCLLSVKHGLFAKADEVVPSSTLANGLLDTLNLAAETLTEGVADPLRGHLAIVPTTLLGWNEWLEHAEKLTGALPSLEGEAGFWCRALAEQIRSLKSELASLYPWLAELSALNVPLSSGESGTAEKQSLPSELREVLNTPAGARSWAKQLPALRAELASRGLNEMVAALDRSDATKLSAQLDELANRSNRFADAMEFRFLYNEARHLFSIGYNVPLERLDSGHYDLLASEAALTCYLAVARGVVPRKHWFQLGRLVTPAAGLPGLISWGGSMFEYLMPRLLLASPPGTMLDVAQKATVARQIEYGRQRHVPWGISESGFYVLSQEGDYQYQSFGVPGMGLKRGLAKDLVVAPYATLLATMTDVTSSVANFSALRAVGGEGPYGFYEAIDFTPDRLRRNEKCRVVQSYMAHHQGMGLCAISNRLLSDIHCRRLYAEPAVKAVDLLLQERVPLDAPEIRPLEAEDEASMPSGVTDEVSRRLTTADTLAPRTQLLSNGQYTVLLTNAGSGFSTCRGLAVTRWRADATRDPYGTFFYIREPATGEMWTAGHQPMGTIADYYEVIFSADKAEVRRRNGQIETWVELVVAPDHDAEIRRITIVNHDITPRTLEVTSFAEIVLNDVRADLAHPAFGKLFLETEWLPYHDSLLCRRRPRSTEQKPVFAVHVVCSDANSAKETEYETDRSKFLGRRRGPDDPEALTQRLSGTTGPVLDPVFALRKRVKVPAGGNAVLSFVTGICDTREQAVALAAHYHTPASADRAFDLAWAHSRVELRHLGVTPAESHVFQRLAGHILYPPNSLRALPSLRDNHLGQPALWPFGISGDVPIIAVSVSEGDSFALARQVLKAHAFWRGRGFPVDLVLLADRPASYREELYQDLAVLARSSDSRDVMDKPGGVFVRKVQPGSDERTLLLAAARVVLYGDRGTLVDQIDSLARGRSLPQDLVPTRKSLQNEPDSLKVEGLVFFNGTGGFSSDGREYVITNTPPAPWINVIANPVCGCIATDSGCSYTWVGNSQANRLTPWSNDPVSDPPAEVVYVRDEETGRFWTPTPLPLGKAAGVWHGPGYTSYASDHDELTTELTIFVPSADPVKILRLRVTNHSNRVRKLSATFFAEWVLGSTREQTAPFIVTEVDSGSGTLLARCAFGESSSAVAFADTNLRPRSLTGDRTEFLGRNRSCVNPIALNRVMLSDHTGPGLDPCAALLGKFDVPPTQSTEVVFVIGQAVDASSATTLATHYRNPLTVASALQDVINAWDRRLSTVVVKTPDPKFDILVNRWLPYQVLACRLWGRSAFYQSGGAYGFRDQLQDVMALLYAEPGEARKHILRAASRQFPEGDVQHWWHPPTGRGVRTRFSDDFLWLPYSVARYVRVTGDTSILNEETYFLRGPALEPHQQEEYFLPDRSDHAGSLYDHCLLALTNGWKLGMHGLPLMGCGDWNDGMNLVGAGGAGESVWVAWFQILVRKDFAEIAEAHGDRFNADRLRAESQQLRDAVEAHAWDGEWYLRAWFDNGTPLGSKSNDECHIDSLPQSWAVLAGGDLTRASNGVEAAMSQLFDREAKLVKLFTPPFDKGTLEPGYIKGYVPGIRENGGQYTHAAIWIVQALAGLRRNDDAFSLWQTLSPLSHTQTPEEVARYKVEPYVVAADVYGVPPHVGRGGWTWYTGSAAWLFRAAIETLLGLTKHNGTLTFMPKIPSGWNGYEVEYRHGSSVYRCRIECVEGEAEVWIDGERLPNLAIPLHDDGHNYDVHFKINRM
jgi:cyclic beta-1,2-glucan synthetase